MSEYGRAWQKSKNYIDGYRQQAVRLSSGCTEKMTLIQFQELLSNLHTCMRAWREEEARLYALPDDE